MGVLLFLVFGSVVGLIARALMPGRQSMGFVMTTVLGVVGSLIGGFVGSLVSDSAPTAIHAAGLIGSVVGAVVVLGIASTAGHRRIRV